MGNTEGEAGGNGWKGMVCENGRIGSELSLVIAR